MERAFRPYGMIYIDGSKFIIGLVFAKVASLQDAYVACFGPPTLHFVCVGLLELSLSETSEKSVICRTRAILKTKASPEEDWLTKPLITIFDRGDALLHGVHLTHELRFEVGSFVFVDDGALGELVDDGEHVWELLGGDVFVLKGSEIAQGVTHGFCVVSVFYSFGFVGTNSFFC